MSLSSSPAVVEQARVSPASPRTQPRVVSTAPRKEDSVTSFLLTRVEERTSPESQAEKSLSDTARDRPAGDSIAMETPLQLPPTPEFYPFGAPEDEASRQGGADERISTPRAPSPIREGSNASPPAPVAGPSHAEDPAPRIPSPVAGPSGSEGSVPNPLPALSGQPRDPARPRPVAL